MSMTASVFATVGIYNAIRIFLIEFKTSCKEVTNFAKRKSAVCSNSRTFAKRPRIWQRRNAAHSLSTSAVLFGLASEKPLGHSTHELGQSAPLLP
jgi:hypothetical protein